MADATEHFQTTANTVDEKLHEVSNQIELVKTLNQKQAVDALDESKAVRQLMKTEHSNWETAETKLRNGIKWAVGIGVCVFVISMSTLAYVLWHFHR